MWMFFSSLFLFSKEFQIKWTRKADNKANTNAKRTVINKYNLATMNGVDTMDTMNTMNVNEWMVESCARHLNEYRFVKIWINNDWKFFNEILK